MIYVVVHQNNGDAACKTIKRLCQFNLIPKKAKACTAYESPSQRRKREKQESARRIRKNRRQRFFDNEYGHCHY